MNKNRFENPDNIWRASKKEQKKYERKIQKKRKESVEKLKVYALHNLIRTANHSSELNDICETLFTKEVLDPKEKRELKRYVRRELNRHLKNK